MTSRARPARARRRSLPATLAVVGSLSAAGFLAIFGGLARQMAAGADPALGPKARTASASATQPANRRIVKRTIVVRKIHDAPAATAAPSGSAPSSASPSPPQSSAPAPAPVVVPPPSAPAPVVTKAS